MMNRKHLVLSSILLASLALGTAACELAEVDDEAENVLRDDQSGVQWETDTIAWSTDPELHATEVDQYRTAGCSVTLNCGLSCSAEGDEASCKKLDSGRGGEAAKCMDESGWTVCDCSWGKGQCWGPNPTE